MSSISLNKNNSDTLQTSGQNIGHSVKENGILIAEQVSSLISLSPHELEAKLAEIFCLTNYRICLEEACLLDSYVSAFWFFTRNRFSNEQVVGFFSLLKIFLDNIKDNQMSLSESIVVMRNNLKKYSESNGAGHPLFSRKQLMLLTDYINESFFQHYKLFQNLFSPQDDDDCIPVKLPIEVPPDAGVPFPPPLDEGMPENVYTEYVAEHSEQDTKVTVPEETNQQKMQSLDEDIPSDDMQETREQLLLSLKSQDVRKIVREVSYEVLNDVKMGVDKKLKDRESQILPKITKR